MYRVELGLLQACRGAGAPLRIKSYPGLALVCIVASHPTRWMLIVVMCLRRSYAAVLGDQNNAWDDGTLTADEIANDAEAAALVLAFQQEMAIQYGVSPDQIVVNSIDGGGRRMLESMEDVTLTIAYKAPHTGKYL
jgi:hypothetical protein